VFELQAQPEPYRKNNIATASLLRRFHLCQQQARVGFAPQIFHTRRRSHHHGDVLLNVRPETLEGNLQPVFPRVLVLRAKSSTAQEPRNFPEPATVT
jgi:hypothetical protein